jgi:hypothetical protein
MGGGNNVREQFDTSDVMQDIKAFLQPVIQALIKERPFVQRWLPGGPWV